MLNGKTVLITGGTGSFGRRFTEIALRKYNPERLIVFSRDELKQSEMHAHLGETEYPNIPTSSATTRSRSPLPRLRRVDIVVHAQRSAGPAANTNPIEAVKTNVLGAANVLTPQSIAASKRSSLSAPTRRPARSASTERRSFAPTSCSSPPTATPDDIARGSALCATAMSSGAVEASSRSFCSGNRLESFRSPTRA